MTSEFTPTTQSELGRFVAENAVGEKRTLAAVGGRTALHYGFKAEEPQTVIAMSGLGRVVDYPARDMTITVEAGMRIEELQSTLASERQRLPIDIAQAGRATVGGALATNTSGSRRFGHGTFRDFVIGISAVDAHGRAFKAGGRVVKNVAGYDICKLMVGSRGTLAIVTQVTFKLRPLAETSALRWSTFASLGDIDRALERLLTSDARPVAIEVLNPAAASLIAASSRCELPVDQPVLCLGVEGSKREVDWQIETLRREVASFGVTSSDVISEPDAAAMWQALTEFQTCADDPLTFQANVRPSRCAAFIEQATRLNVAVQAHAANGIVIGQLPESAATVTETASILTELRQTARAANGNLHILHCDPEWQPLLLMCGDPEPTWPLMRQLKRKLDPNGLLNPRLFVDGTAMSDE